MTGNDSTCMVTPRLQTSSNHNDSWQFTPASTSLGARSFSCAGSSFSQRTDITNGGMLSVDLPVAQQDSLRLYDPARARTPAAGHQRSASSGSILSLISSRKRGHLDPDVALAMAFETVVCMVLHEEETLRLCFGLTEGDDQSNNGVDSEGELFLPTTDRTQGCVKVDRATLLRESLAELFGGEKVVIFSPGISGASLTEDPQGGKSYPSTRRGSSCSTSVAVKGEEYPDEDGSCSASSRSYLQRQLVDLLKYVGERCDRLYMLPVMVMIKAYRRSGSVVASSSFCQMIFQALEPVLASTVSRSVMEQTASIKTCTRRYLINPSGLLICFLKLPTFVQKLESMHDALPPALRSHKEYTSYVLTLVDQCFESLNCVTNLTKSEASCEVKLSRLECLSRRGYRIFNGNGESTKSADHSFLQQYRHHAFFCSFYDSLHPMCNAVGLLRERYESSCALRDRYQELYLTRVVLVKEFPEFGPFALVAEDLAQVHTVDELRHHSTFSVDAMRNIVADMSQEVRNGIKRSSEKMKKHFLRDVARRKDEVSFNCMLLQQVWSSFTTLFLQKFDFLSAVAEWPIYTDLEVPITREEVVALLETV
ncbi:unnamed protein product [Trypanosoma congolense IL3000]|uniref:WGS project CAEQ00000000 data, annotated contig 2006 n=1 Tax=Trypanosoma congolense (strain IL3000) TaxID=1068625 RepID=F9WAR1_TRYCI|nr:unnamed protein product [Trypanosoma congolense IL3000]